MAGSRTWASALALLLVATPVRAQQAAAFAVGLVTIGAMLGWEKFRPASMKLVPGALVGVVAATLVAFSPPSSRPSGSVL